LTCPHRPDFQVFPSFSSVAVHVRCLPDWVLPSRALPRNVSLTPPLNIQAVAFKEFLIRYFVSLSRRLSWCCLLIKFPLISGTSVVPSGVPPDDVCSPKLSHFSFPQLRLASIIFRPHPPGMMKLAGPTLTPLFVSMPVHGLIYQQTIVFSERSPSPLFPSCSTFLSPCFYVRALFNLFCSFVYAWPGEPRILKNERYDQYIAPTALWL